VCSVDMVMMADMLLEGRREGHRWDCTANIPLSALFYLMKENFTRRCNPQRGKNLTPSFVEIESK